jgi:hypothetical protein
MEKCLVDLYSAATQISPRYFRAIGTRVDQTQYPQNIEQSFSAELYHRFKSIMEIPSNVEYYDNLILQFDITKLAVNSRPDLVLHEDQENVNNQKMYIEVKSDPSASLTNDFDKLIMATDTNYLNFENVVLIVVNRPFNSTLQAIYDHANFINLDQERKRRIFIVNIEEVENQEIEYNLYSIKYLPNNNNRRR